MDKTYTTAELLQVLKRGQEAQVEGTNDVARMTKYGGLCWVRQNRFVELGAPIVNARWRILPQYVDFMTAFKAWREGKTIRNDEYRLIWRPSDKAIYCDESVESDKWIIEEAN